MTSVTNTQNVWASSTNRRRKVHIHSATDMTLVKLTFCLFHWTPTSGIKLGDVQERAGLNSSYLQDIKKSLRLKPKTYSWLSLRSKPIKVKKTKTKPISVHPRLLKLYWYLGQKNHNHKHSEVQNITFK